MTRRSLSWWIIPRLSALASTLGWTRCSCCVNRTSSCTLRWTGFVGTYEERAATGNAWWEKPWLSLDENLGRECPYLCTRLAPSPRNVRAGVPVRLTCIHVVLRTSVARAKDPAHRNTPYPTDLSSPLSPHRPTTSPRQLLGIYQRTLLPHSPPGRPVSALPLGSCGPSGLTGSFFVFCSCFWVRSLSANRWASKGLEAAAAEQNGFGLRVKRLPKRHPVRRTQRPGALQAGAAILPGREERAKTTCRRMIEGGGSGRGLSVTWAGRGLGRVTWGRCALSAAAQAGICSWSGGVWRGRGECVGKPGWGWAMSVSQRLTSSRPQDLRSQRALPWETVSPFGRRSYSKTPPRPRAPRGSDAP